MASLSRSFSAPADPRAGQPPIGQRQASRLVPELIILGSTSLVCLALYSVGSFTAVSLVSASVMLIVMAVANFRMVADDPLMMLTPLFGVRLIAMVVFGFGALFNLFAPLEIRSSYDIVYPYTDAEAAKVNLLWLLGMATLLAGMATTMRFDRPRRALPQRQYSLGSVPIAVGLWMFQLSFAVSVANIILSLVTRILIPGIIDTLLLGFELCGLFLIAQHAVTSRRALVTLIVGLVALLLAAVLLHAKTLALYPALIIMIGVLSNRVTWRRTLASAALIMLIFFVISPIVTYGRERMANEYGEGGSGSLSDRWRYISDYAGGDRGRGDDVGTTMSRLDYIMPASFIMGQYDQGLASDRLATSAYIFIPRLIWPEKPITSTAGLDTNHLLGIQTTNNVGVTTFVDLYWNIGWFALLVSGALGFYFGIVTVMSHRLATRGEWLLIPFALSSLRLSLSLDSDFTSGIMAPAVINFIIYMALRFISRFARHLPVSHAHAG
ncbi:MAG: hypothetical protein ABIR77_05200 [Sphingomicrobium sp.]